MINNAINWSYNSSNIAINLLLIRTIKSKQYQCCVHSVPEHRVAALHPWVPDLLSGCGGSMILPNKSICLKYVEVYTHSALFLALKMNRTLHKETRKAAEDSRVSFLVESHFSLAHQRWKLALEAMWRLSWGSTPNFHNQCTYGILATYTLSGHLSEMARGPLKSYTLASGSQMVVFPGCLKS